ncbi:glutamate-1-semialdehyde-2,1-aminomutase [Legionella rubrilucens]|uniref:Glutamate-1-semialdehyde 2,1-aminomutase n=2 Tax=Legionella rubrilucens TaxID=458 RepID=A0A0W0XLP8_9GAMM|nr:glutamate-1-semialdehyde-2,1-aminomutase [Legionella rubrilucens]
MTLSSQLFEQAQALFPGGVNSPVRAFKSVGGTPVFFKEGRGAYLIDVDGKEYIDYVGSWGSMILGHCNPAVVEAAREAVGHFLSFGAPSVQEIELGKRIIELMPSMEKIRFMNSGTEATMTALRLARGYTGRNKIIKFKGCYHGHSDFLLAKAGSGVLTLGIPSTPGVPASVTEHTLIADYNQLDEVVLLFKNNGHDIAAVIVEPVCGNMGFVLPQEGFLQGLRALCDQYGALLLFDEVMTGFRVALGGAQALFNVKPDLTTLGKVIGGGMPVGALGGRAEIMDYLAPLGGVYQAGTLSGNPLVMTIGLATINQLATPGFFARLSKTTNILVQGLNELGDRLGIPLHALSRGGMFGFFFNPKKEIAHFSDIAEGNEALFNCFFHGMLDKGIYLAPSMFEAGFVSICHGQDEIDKTLSAAEETLQDSVTKNLMPPRRSLAEAPREKTHQEALIQTADYFNQTGFDRWKLIYSNSDKANFVQKIIRKGHNQIIDSLIKYLTETNNIRGKRFCDAGCGVGMVAIELSKQEPSAIFASDISQAMVNEAKSRYQQQGNLKTETHFTVSNLEDLQGKFDNVICLDVIFHYPQEVAEQMVDKLFQLGNHMVIISFAPYSIFFAGWKKLGGFFPGAKKATRAHLLKMKPFINLAKKYNFKPVFIKKTKAVFYYSTLVIFEKKP